MKVGDNAKAYSCAVFGRKITPQRVRHIGLAKDATGQAVLTVDIDHALSHEKVAQIVDLIEGAINAYSRHQEVSAPKAGHKLFQLKRAVVVPRQV